MTSSEGFRFAADPLSDPVFAAAPDSAPAAVRGAPVSERTALELLGRLGLADRADHQPGRLSGGEQQRLAVACGVVGGPALVVADEPTAELDTVAAERVLTAIEDLAAAG